MYERYSHCFQTKVNWEMGSDHQGRSNTRIPQPHRFDGYMGEEQERLQHHHLQGYQYGLSFHRSSHPHPQSHPLSSAQPHDLHKAIYREIEKERIRQEIIMSEILRRRELEAEVRREMMMERALALGGSNTFPFVSPSPIGLDLPMRLPLVETRSHEERILLSHPQRNNLNNGHESDRCVPLPFQSASDDARVARNSEVKPILEGVREKQKIILQATPIQNATGAKRARSGSDASGSQSDGKKAKKEMSCALCQVRATSERSLNDHLKGNMHKTKEAELRTRKTGKSYSIGLTTKKAAKPIQGSGPVDPGMQSEMKFTPESLPFSKSGDIVRSATDSLPPTQEDLTSDKLMKKELVVPEQVIKKDKPEKKDIRCEICQISVSNQQIMDSHKTGKKHRRELDKRSKCSGVGPSQKKELVVPEQAKKKDKPEKKDIRCEICQISVSNQQIMDSHKTGKKHRRELDKRSKCGGVDPSQKDAAVE